MSKKQDTYQVPILKNKFYENSSNVLFDIVEIKMFIQVRNQGVPVVAQR